MGGGNAFINSEGKLVKMYKYEIQNCILHFSNEHAGFF